MTSEQMTQIIQKNETIGDIAGLIDLYEKNGNRQVLTQIRSKTTKACHTPLNRWLVEKLFQIKSFYAVTL